MASFRNLATFVLLSLACGAFAAIGPVTDLEIVNANVSPDGFNRAAVLAGGTFPGPLITGSKGDNFRINVVDHLTNDTMLTATSIHWHGLFQHGNNWADGGAFVNQCPIVAGNSFLYDFTAADQAGTYWYHSHLNTQYCDGLRGAMVVYDPNDPHKDLYDVDDESTVITLADWYHVAAPLQQGVPAADATLINGLGRWFGNPTSELAVINVTHGKRYRFRLVSVSCDPNFTFQIDGHSMTVIEADGQSTQPLPVDQLTIFAGQRYSFVLDANQDVGNYWIRASPNVVAKGGSGFANGINSAILRYDGALEEEPTTTQDTAKNVLSEINLQALEDPAAPGEPVPGGVDYALNLGISFTAPDFKINGTKFVPPDVPVLLQILSGQQNPQDLLPEGSVFTLPGKSTIELSIPAFAIGGPHPFHLHGHAFSVVKSAGQSEPNYANPVRRDVVSIGSGSDNVTIRFTTDNPGPWFLHCHIDWHFQAGLAVVFAEDLPETSVANLSLAWSDLCPEYQASLKA
ncbi:multicopper oxidase [Polyporus arcularius HHB13444]|uniref:laccase n=1 Tax=Polyporus arcularius HHB13444 TaxID=1314778 RepID=A0A5C3P0W7_9APHY|nr:multicopper oxidase [Polyporus arcularius HHB13444]